MKKISPILIAVMAAGAALTTPAHSQTLFPIEVPNGDFEIDRDDKVGGLPEGEDVYMEHILQKWYQYDVNTNGGPQRYWNPSATPVAGPRFADSGFGGIAPDGDHVGIAITRYNDDRLPDGSSGAVGDYVRDFEALAQVLEDVLFDPAETYELTVKVGHGPGDPNDPQHGTKTYEWNGYMVQLLAGGEEFDEGGLYAGTVFKSNGGTVIAEDNNSTVIAVNTFETITVTYTPGDLTPEQETALAGLPIQIRLCALENPLDHSTNSIVAFDSVTLAGPEQLSGSDYATWASGFAGFTDSSENLDFDGGSLESGIEYVVGGDPTDGSDDAGKAPILSTDETSMTFTFDRDQVSIHPNTTVTIEVGTDLATWPDIYTVGADTAGSTAGVTVTKDTSPGFDTVTLTVPKDLDTKKFARLQMLINP